jgi:SAM-dependent methyltransferase
VTTGGDASSYDVLEYPPRPFVQTHPDRLATLATLFGLSPTPPARCRVLELGCGVGGNLLPMAAALPGATFVGIDNAAVPIARARELTERLGLGNVSFHPVGIEEYEPPGEPFDYVIAHGVYSWVPEPVRDALLALCARVLSPDGVAYVSYNALPGGHLRQMLRGVLAAGLGGVEEPAERVAAARRFLAMLVKAGDADDELVPTLGRAAREVIDRDDAFLFHDVLAEDNQPYYLHEFVARATAHGLAYLSEAQFSEMQVDVLPPSLQPVLRDIADPVRRDGLLDVLKERRFRQTLLCRADRRPDPEPKSERLAGMAVSGALRWTADESSGRVTFLGPGTAHVVSDHPLVVRTLRAIGESWPSPLPIAVLGEERELPAIGDILLRCYATNLVRLHVHPPRVSTAPPERPRVSPVARLEAAEGTMVTTVRHTHLELDDDVARRVATLLDGSRDRADLVEAIGDLAAVDAALARLAGAGMLLP